jgi:hypothetical protein
MSASGTDGPVVASPPAFAPPPATARQESEARLGCLPECRGRRHAGRQFDCRLQAGGVTEPSRLPQLLPDELCLPLHRGREGARVPVRRWSHARDSAPTPRRHSRRRTYATGRGSCLERLLVPIPHAARDALGAPSGRLQRRRSARVTGVGGSAKAIVRAAPAVGSTLGELTSGCLCTWLAIGAAVASVSTPPHRTDKSKAAGSDAPRPGGANDFTRERSWVDEGLRGYYWSMVIAVIVAVCVLLLLVAFLAPRLSRKPQHGVDRAVASGGNVAGKAPGRLGRWLRKPFSSSQRAADKSAALGRRGRGKMPR